MPRNISLEEQLVAVRRMVNLTKAQKHLIPRADVDALWAVLETLTDLRMAEMGKDPRNAEWLERRAKVRGCAPIDVDALNRKTHPVLFPMLDAG